MKSKFVLVISWGVEAVSAAPAVANEAVTKTTLQGWVGHVL